MYYSTKKRRYELGVFQIGDPFLTLYNEEVGDGIAEHTFDCPASCTTWAMQEKVTVVREHLHMHKTGMAMKSELIRNGEMMHVSRSDFFAFDQVRLSFCSPAHLQTVFNRMAT